MNNQRVVLITGCSSGFGLLTAVHLAHRGEIVWATMRDFTKRSELDNALAKSNAKANIRELDVTKPATIKRVVDEIKETHGKIDILINNAGYGIAGFFEDLTDAEIRGVMETNFYGVQNVCREIIPIMRERKNGKIINISSVAGQVATPSIGAYSASKWALEAFSEALYYELSLFGISVCLIEPGSYPTNIFTTRAHYAKNFDNPQSPYFYFSQKIKKFADKMIKGLKKDPMVVVMLIEKIIDVKHPKLRYVSDFSSWARMMTQKLLPRSLSTFIFRRIIDGN